MQATQVPTDRSMDKKSVEFTYNRILLSLKNTEGNSGPCYNMDGFLRHYAEWNKQVTKRQLSYDSIYMS